VPGTVPLIVADGQPSNGSSCARDAVVLGSIAIFFADDGVRGCEPWKSDGTAAGTALVKDINPGPTGSFDGSQSQRQLAVMGAFAYFVANDGVSGYELWRTDGTEAGTTIVKDIDPGPASGK